MMCPAGGGMCWRRPSTYPTKSMASFCSELTLYVPTHIVGAYRGVSAIGGPATLVRHITRRCQAVHLEPGIDQHSACMAQVLQRVGMHIHVRAREAVEVLR